MAPSDWREMADYPHLILIGAQKAGTTALFDQLSTHPRVHACAKKEPHFFSEPRTPDELADYQALFSPGPGQLTIEASTSYTFLPEKQDTHHRIHEHRPDAKLVYIVRDPVERIRSHLRHRWLSGAMRGSADEAVRDDPIYVDRTRYWTQLEPYIEVFGADAVHVVVTEEYLRSPQAVMAGLGAFSGLDPDGFGAVPRSNESEERSGPRFVSVQRRVDELARRGVIPWRVRRAVAAANRSRLPETGVDISEDTAAEIRAELEAEVAGLERFLGRPIEDWG